MGRRQLKKEVIRERRQVVRETLRLLEKKLDEDARNRGDSRENLVRDALELLRTDAAIASFRMTSHGDEDDRRGIDAWVYDFHGNEKKLQVKGSWKWVLEHRRRHPEIPVILVDRDGPVRAVMVKISRALRIPLPTRWSK